ncbi:NAD(P)-dependent oxidoreductase [Candidatus Entotheonella palauensis]|uniref:NAD(P)-dependent oxidoreductase n=1 Tax=Candidatus Entotheonella palauensis TaxID=93172 RepID=UPI000B7D0D4D|nr:NAD(P)-dependent oxidoreductase [Candidatus Entotheonella palauensis]
MRAAQTPVKVFVFAPADPTGETHQRLQDQGCELVFGNPAWENPGETHEAEMAAMAAGCEALVGTSIRSSPITKRIMASSSNLRIVAKYSIGVDDVDVEAATELGILVTHSPTESNWGGVAEGTVTCMLTMLKKVRERDRHLKEEAGWKESRLEGTYVGSRADGYAGITLGLIGLGRVGGRVAALMRPWNMRILACDPYVPDAKFDELGVERTDLNTLLSESDVVSLHVVLNRETRHMIGAEQFGLMKPSALFINTARGFCVDETALAEALERDRIAGAAIDAFEYEPLAADSPLRRLGDKVLLSPHMISATVGSGLGPGISWATDSVLQALRGEVPDCVFNQEVIPQWQSRFGGKSVWGANA